MLVLIWQSTRYIETFRLWRPTYSPILSCVLKLSLSHLPELEEPVVIKIRQRYGQSRHSGAACLWNHIQLLWAGGQLPSRTDPN